MRSDAVFMLVCSFRNRHLFFVFNFAHLTKSTWNGLWVFYGDDKCVWEAFCCWVWAGLNLSYLCFRNLNSHANFPRGLNESFKSVNAFFATCDEKYKRFMTRTNFCELLLYIGTNLRFWFYIVSRIL